MPEPTDIAARVSAAWTAVLDASPAPDARFLAAGGHSLAAARLIARLNAELGAELPMSAVLRDDPTLAELVTLVAGRAGVEVVDVVPPSEVALPARSVPLAPTVRRIWTWHRLRPDSPAYNVVRVLDIAGRLQPGPLRAALADLAERHEALRCAVAEPAPGMPEVVVGEPVAVPLSVEVVRDTGEDTMAAVDAALYRVADRPFPMAAPPLWRVGLVYVPALGHTWLILVMHHLIADMRAADVVFADLADAYRSRVDGATPSFTEPAPSLLTHLAHERQLVGTPRWENHLAWWSDQLAGATTATPLPLSTMDNVADNAGRTHTVALPSRASDALDRALREQGLTPAIFFLTVASLVLGAWSGQDRAEVIGLPSVRMTRPEDERLVAFLLDTLLLPVATNREQSLTDAYQAVRDAYADAADHALPAYDDILDRLRLPRGPGTGSPLIRLWFNDMTQAAPPATFGGHAVAEYDLPPAWALFNLVLYLRRSPAGYRLHLVTPRGSADPADMAALAEQIVRTAEQAAANPARPVGDLLEAPAQARTESPAKIDVESTVDLVRRHARERPTAVAVSDQDGALDYRSLNTQVDELAARLAPGAVVAVPARRNRQLVVRLLACWRADATAVLVDAEWPDQRRRRALDIAAVTHVFPWSGDGPVTPTPTSAAAQPVGAAHVLFTSGTTGDPLAVRTSTWRADTAIADLADRLAVRADDRASMLSGPAHDPVLRDLGLALRAGATVCIPPPDTFADPAGMGAWLRRERVTVVNATPTMLALVLGADPQPLPDLRTVVCGGSPLSATTAGLIRSRAAGAVIVNGYGCTETPQLVVAHELAPGEPIPASTQVPIGAPLPGRRVEVRTQDGHRCDLGHLGELWVADPHIADGYLGNGTDDRFTVDVDGTRWLRTGDLARLDAAGRLHLAGRRDRQQLVNGYRVTLEEVEAVARGCAGVAEAVARVVGDDGRQTIRVWVQRAAGVTVVEGAVRAHLAAVLPPSVVPTRVLVVDRLDLTDNLKPAAPDHTPEPGLPDRALRELAESMLGGPLDPTTNFFDAGFTSASLLQLSAELTDVLGRPVEPLRMFDHPNLSALSAFLFGAPVTPPPRPETANATVPDPSDRLARLRSDRRKLRSWIQESVTPPR